MENTVLLSSTALKLKLMVKVRNVKLASLFTNSLRVLRSSVFLRVDSLAAIKQTFLKAWNQLKPIALSAKRANLW